MGKGRAGGLTSEAVKDRPFQTKGRAMLTNLYLSSRGEVAETDDRLVFEFPNERNPQAFFPNQSGYGQRETL